MASSRFTERPLDEEEWNQIAECSKVAAERIRIGLTEEPDRIVRSIRDCVYKVRPLTGEDLNEQALELGCLWGEQVARALDWKWAELHRNEEFAGYGIVSPDRAMVVFPAAYLRELLADDERDNTTLLLFNMLSTDKFHAVPRAYEVIK